MTGKGIDIVEIARIERACRNRRFCERVFTEAELERAKSGVGLARRFALKEALLKALGTGLTGSIRWKDVEFVDPDGRGLRLHGRVRNLLEGRKIHFGSAHSSGLAIATVVIE